MSEPEGPRTGSAVLAGVIGPVVVAVLNLTEAVERLVLLADEATQEEMAPRIAGARAALLRAAAVIGEGAGPPDAAEGARQPAGGQEP